MDYLPLILGLLPSFAWLFFYLEEDPHPEPKKLIFETFLAGALITFIVLGMQSVANDFMIGQGVNPYSLISFLILGSIEEVCKFLAAKSVINSHKKDFDEPVDAMIYMIVAALGFAAVENIAAARNAPHLAFETATLRFIGANLLHTLASGLVGYYWARSMIFKKKTELLTGFALAALLHAVFNFLILRFEPLVISVTFLIVFAIVILFDFEKLKRLK